MAQQRQAMKKAADAGAAQDTTPAQADQQTTTPAQAAPEPEPARAAVKAPDAEKPKGNGRRAGRPKGSTNANAFAVAAPAAQAGAVELVDKVFELAQQCGGFGALKRLVDRIAGRSGAE